MLNLNEGPGMRKILVIIGACLNIVWGMAHIFPTGNVVKSFGNITVNNKQILLMEWLNESLTLNFIGILVLVTVIIEKENTKLRKAVFGLAASMLFSMAVLSLFTGFRINFLPYKLCPLIFSISGAFILQGIFIK